MAVTSTGTEYYDQCPTAATSNCTSATPWTKSSYSIPAARVVALQCNQGYDLAGCLAVTSSGGVYYTAGADNAWAEAAYSIPAAGIIALQCDNGYNGYCLAVTSSGGIYYSQCPAVPEMNCSSPTDWTEAPPAVPSVGITAMQCQYGYNGGYCLAATSGKVDYYSQEPTNMAWAPADALATTGVTAMQCQYGYNGGYCLAATSEGTVYYNEYPVNSSYSWAKATNSIPASDVVGLQCDYGYSDGHCIAVTSSGLIYTNPSPTTGTWTSAPTAIPVTFTAGPYTLLGTVAASRSSYTLPSGTDYYEVAAANHAWVGPVSAPVKATG